MVGRIYLPTIMPYRSSVLFVKYYFRVSTLLSAVNASLTGVALRVV